MNHVSFVRIGIKSWSNSSSTYWFLVILQIYINLYPVDKFIRSLKHRGYLHIYIKGPKTRSKILLPFILGDKNRLRFT